MSLITVDLVDLEQLETKSWISNCAGEGIYINPDNSRVMSSGSLSDFNQVSATFTLCA
jgi:hypothetical protein